MKTLIERCESRGEPRRVLEFLNTHEALSEESAEKIATEIEKRRRRAVPRKVLIE